MNHLHHRFICIILGLAGFLWPRVAHDVYGQSVKLDNVNVIRGLDWIQVDYSFVDLPVDYDQENIGLVVFVLKYTFDDADGNMKYMSYDTISSINFDFMTMIGDGIPISWTDLSSDHGNVSERYALKLEDFAGNPMGIITSGHQTIFLDGISDEHIDRCSGSISLRWENYKMFVIDTGIDDEDERPSGFTHNRIMYLPPGGFVDQVADTLDFDSLTYDFVFMDGPGEYLIWVQAVELDGGGETLRYSNSNFRTVVFESPVLTELEIPRVDVIGNREMKIVFHAEGGQPGDLDEFEFDVYRSDSLAGEYIRLAGAPVYMGSLSPTSGAYSFTDNTIPDIQSGPYYYYVTGRLVECDELFMASTVVSSLFLTGDIQTHTETQLIVWLEGSHFPGGMDYQLYRKLPGDVDLRLVGSFDVGLPYTDDLSEHIETLAGGILYRLVGTSGADEVVSNVVSIYVNVGLEVYNAFRPDSQLEDNRTFRPRLMGVTPTLFRLVVYNNWGQEMYSFFSQNESLDDWAGWDGSTKDGWEAPPGVYGYKIEYQAGGIERIEKRGLVTLIR